MPGDDDFKGVVDALHAAGLDATLWPEALGRMTNLFGSVGTTFETVDRNAARISDFWSHGIPKGSELTYAEHYMAISPRMKLSNWHRPGDVGYDSMVIDEAGMRADAYYSDFLARVDMRYFISITVVQNAAELACLAVQRSPREGHAERDEIRRMAMLVPHVRQAFDTTRRLRDATHARRAFEHALDWLPEAVMLVRSDGVVTYLNAAAQQCARRGDGIRVVRGRLDFQSHEARGHLDAALAAVKDRDGISSAGADFTVMRAPGTPPYLVSVRRVVDPRAQLGAPFAQTLAIVFIRDPLVSAAMPAGHAAREVFGLTEAEAAFADALSRGISVTDYAQTRQVSLNTVYTHLRHIKTKTGSRRLSELVTKLTELKAPLLDEEQPRDG